MTWKNTNTGGLSSMTDVVTISLRRDQLHAYRQALSCALNHVEEARGNENMLNFLSTLIELSDTAQIAFCELDKIPTDEWDPAVRERSLKARRKTT